MSSKKGSLAKKVLTLGAIAAVPATYVTVGNNIFNKMFVINKAYKDKDLLESLPDDYTKEQYRLSLVDNLSWFKASKISKLQIQSYEGLTLDAVKITNHSSAAPFMILVHGLNTDRYALLQQAHEFDKMGFNLLMIDQRGFGQSAGEFTSYGFKESLDLLQWIEYLVDNDAKVKIGLYGVSLGAATVLNVLGYQLPENVVFAISDAAYTSMTDLIKLRAKTPVLTSYVCNRVSSVLGIDPKEVNLIRVVKQTRIPILFMHGSDDKIIPVDMCNILFNCANGPKEIYITENGNHAYNCYKEGYFKAICDFIKNIL